MKQRYSICPLSWFVLCNFVLDGNYSEMGWACTPPSPAWADFSIMMECPPAIATLCVLCACDDVFSKLFLAPFPVWPVKFFDEETVFYLPF